MPDATPAASRAADVRVRAARPSDAGELGRIEQAAFSGDRMSIRSLRALITSQSARMLVAEAADGLAGYALVLMRRGSRAARLYSLAVLPEAAGRGIGSRLLYAAEAAATAAGAGTLRLEVRDDNTAAIALYERSGYRRIGGRENYYADGMAARRYARSLMPHNEAATA